MMDQPRLLALTSDFVFRALFTRSESSLIDLLNAALRFEGEQRIESLTLQPTEILKEHVGDKSVVLDIKARSHAGDLFNIEMQALEQHFYSARPCTTGPDCIPATQPRRELHNLADHLFG